MNTYEKIEDGMEGVWSEHVESLVWWLWLIVMVLSFPFIVVVAAVVRVIEKVRKVMCSECRDVCRDWEYG